MRKWSDFSAGQSSDHEDRSFFGNITCFNSKLVDNKQRPAGQAVFWDMLVDNKQRPAGQAVFWDMLMKSSNHVLLLDFPTGLELKAILLPLSQVSRYVPLAVVEEILLNLPAHQVVQVCRLVCRNWKVVVDSGGHWRKRCRREGIQPCDASRPPEDWRQFYFLRGRRNLIKNPSAEDEFSGWEIVQNGGDGWTVEDNSLEIPNHTVPKCFVTSYMLCLKRQLIDLTEEGYSAAFMDQQQPHIKISDWCAPRCDCGTEYQICVELLDQEQEPISTFEPESVYYPRLNDLEWCEMTHTFKDYGPGVRFIRFTHGGRDADYCRGLFGILVTNSSVEICPV